jgi:2',3'-cyclic-nucleotide 2'-phosphodiesterase (5'-nucleotidase family)
VAFFGLTWAHPETIQPMPLTLADPMATARKLVPELREKAEVVVAVTHIGLAQDKRLATTVEGLDLILGGHSHDVLPKGAWANAPDRQKVLIGQAGDYLRRLGVVTMKLARTNGHWQITGQTVRLISLDDNIRPDDDITQIIDSRAKIPDPKSE